MKNFAVVIPAYNEETTIRQVIQRTLRYGSPVIVVNDGSTDNTATALLDLPITLLRNPVNQGKAISLWKGMQTALAMGVSAVITLDADGQHQPEDIPRFIEQWQATPESIVIGSRLANSAAFPRQRYYANNIANFWISWAAGYAIADSQSGFRLYPVELLKQLQLKLDKSKSFVFESEVLIQAAKLGVTSVPIPIAAVYAKAARPSHFRAVMDIVRITRMVAWQLLSRGFCPYHFFNVFIKPYWQRWRLDCVGGDGLAMLILSNLVLMATGGISLLWSCGRVYRVARSASSQAKSLGYRVVLGQRLSKTGLTEEYAGRLDRAKLSLNSSMAGLILIVGGRNGTSAVTEAQAGRDYLVKQGIALDQIQVEDSSRHTLENLQQVRSLLTMVIGEPVVFISNRYHLARIQAIANGLGIPHELCAAESQWQLRRITWWHLLKEGYLLHWYYVGKWWTQVTGHVKMSKRIS
jgi:glycosyltransferase involved in cell wall biosynthesis